MINKFKEQNDKIFHYKKHIDLINTTLLIELLQVEKKTKEYQFRVLITLMKYIQAIYRK